MNCVPMKTISTWRVMLARFPEFGGVGSGWDRNLTVFNTLKPRRYESLKPLLGRADGQRHEHTRTLAEIAAHTYLPAMRADDRLDDRQT